MALMGATYASYRVYLLCFPLKGAYKYLCTSRADVTFLYCALIGFVAWGLFCGGQTLLLVSRQFVFFFLHCFSLGVVLPGPMCETVRMRPKGASV